MFALRITTTVFVQNKEVTELIKIIVLLMALASAFSTPAFATPMVGFVLNNGSNYSVIHYGNNGSGAAPRNEWLWFDDGQSIAFDFDGTTISSSTDQIFTLSDTDSPTGTATVTFTGFNIDTNILNNGTNGQFVGYLRCLR